MSGAWDALLGRMHDLADIGGASALLGWDQTVNLPDRGAAGRARQLATIGAIYHERLTDPEVGRLLDDLKDDESLEQWQTACIRILKRDYDKATKLPEELVRQLAESTGIAYHVWVDSRPKSDFATLKPHLETVVELKKKYADAIGWERERYDALLDDYEPNMTAAELEQVFGELVAGLAPITDAVFGVTRDKPEWLSAESPPADQLEFCKWLVAHIGFEFEGGRVDETPHPFSITIGPGDVRQTTRTNPNYLLGSIYASMHESGHALYEQGIPIDWVDKPVGGQPSLGMHESQSRMWENQVGRSREFTDWLLPHLKERFPGLGMLTPDDFYRGVNHSERSLIRVEADELTYNLHVALRFELEAGLYRDDIAVADLPEIWNEKMESYVGIRPPNDSDGVMQDMHWAIGHHGYFPTYTLGNLYSAAFFAKASEDLGGLSEDLRAGDGSRLLGWLREKIHSQGYLYDSKELAKRILGEPVGAKPLLDYLRKKYGELYELSI